MNMSIHEHVIFVIFEQFQVKAFYFSKDTTNAFTLNGTHTMTLPLYWKEDEENRARLIHDILQFFIRTFALLNKDYFFSLIVDDPLYKAVTIEFPYAIHVLTHKDFSLVPYFASAYLESPYTLYTHNGFKKSVVVDNKAGEWSAVWNGWEDVAALIVREAQSDDAAFLHTWLNVLIRPTFYTANFFLPATIALLLQMMSVIPLHPDYVAIGGGELFSAIKDPEDVLFAFVTGIYAPGSFRNIYHDTQNILAANKALKDNSLSLLEKSMGMYVNHIGDIISIAMKKPVKTGTVIGKVIVHDDEGYKTLYPLVDDILTIKVKGIAKVHLDLHFPFYMKTPVDSYRARDILIIDTRRQNLPIANMHAWYNRIKEYDIY